MTTEETENHGENLAEQAQPLMAPDDPEYRRLNRGVFLSDLHLFSSRSDSQQSLDNILRYKDERECIVLGGDVFDFRWSTVGGLKPTIDAAQSWIQELLDRSGDSQIIYLAGNHDSHPQFANIMRALAEREERFRWIDHTLQIGDCLFLHGDILNAGTSDHALAVYREKHHEIETKHPTLHQIYDLGVRLRLHNAVAKLNHSPKTTCARLRNYVLSFDDLDVQPIKRVFFGHTHVPIPGLTLDGQTYFNPGAMLKYSKYAPLHFDLKHNA